MEQNERNVDGFIFTKSEEFFCGKGSYGQCYKCSNTDEAQPNIKPIDKD